MQGRPHVALLWHIHSWLCHRVFPALVVSPPSDVGTFLPILLTFTLRKSAKAISSSFRIADEKFPSSPEIAS